MDDNVPLVETTESSRSKVKGEKIIWIIISSLFVFLLTLVIILSLLYIKLFTDKVPEVLLSPNSLRGRYAKASVASDHIRCSETGRDILLEGGNAVDAAIATMLCLGVMNPMSSGLGGGHFMTIYNGTTQECHVVDAREQAARAAHRDMFKGQSDASQKGWKAVGVPGELHGLRTEYLNFGGKVSWKRLFKPSIKLLNVGIPVSEALAVVLQTERENVLNESTLSDFVNKETGDVYQYGDVMHNRIMLRDTLRFLSESEDPIKDFYDGWMTDQFASEFEDNGGIITKEDFQHYKSIIRKKDEIIRTELRNSFICGPPPPSSSAITQSIIKILDSYAKDFDESTTDGMTDILHKYIETFKFAYARRGDLGDIDYVKDALSLAKNITSESFVSYIRSRITEKAHTVEHYNEDFDFSDDRSATNIAVFDNDGNAVVATTTVNLLFGSQVASESTGVIWNSQMNDFSLPDRKNSHGYPPYPANFIEPGKRPMSFISPLIIVNKTDNKVQIVVGSAGGSNIISTVSSVVLKVLLLEWDLKKALDSPRLHNQFLPNVVQYEQNFPKEYVKKLAARGHALKEVIALGESTGIKPGNTLVISICDFRKGAESQPSGY